MAPPRFAVAALLTAALAGPAAGADRLAEARRAVADLASSSAAAVRAEHAVKALSDTDRLVLWREAQLPRGALAELLEADLRQNASRELQAAAAIQVNLHSPLTEAELREFRVLLGQTSLAAWPSIVAVIEQADDDLAVPQLMAIAAEGGERAARAGEAVRRLVAGDLPAAPAQWAEWWQQEQDAARSRMTAIAAALAGSHPPTLEMALRDLGALRNLRSQAAPAAVPFLAHGDAGVATQARTALETLGGPVARSELAKRGVIVAPRHARPAAAIETGFLAKAAAAAGGGWIGWLIVLGIPAVLAFLLARFVHANRALLHPRRVIATVRHMTQRIGTGLKNMTSRVTRRK